MTFPRRIVFASTNAGKLREIRRAVSDQWQVASLEDVALGRPVPAVLEIQDTYAAIARNKALEYARWLQQPCIADDTGLEIPSLAYLPGKYTARFGVDRLLSMLGSQRVIPARFVCAMSYADPRGRTIGVTATLEGELRIPPDTTLVTGPLPYSVIFFPRDPRGTLTSEPLSELGERFEGGSHRARAVRTLLKVI